MTDFTTPRTWNIGELITKAMLDQQIRDNENAMWVFTAAGQIAVSSTANRLTILDAASNGNKIIRSNGTTWELATLTRYFTVGLNLDIALVAGDDAARIRIPSELNSYRISEVAMSRKSGTGVLTVQLRNVRTGNDVLSTKLTIDSGETDSSTAAAPAVINTANDDVSTGDQIAVDVDVSGTSTLIAVVQIGLVRY